MKFGAERRERYLRHLLSVVFVILLFILGLPAQIFVDLPQTEIIRIGSFDGSRSRAPFATSGAYNQIRSSLLDTANFGSGGVVNCTVEIAAGTPTITSTYLADKDIFFSSVFTGTLTTAEADAIRNFVANGGCVIVDADSGSSEQLSANSLLSAIGTSASMGPSTGSSSSITTVPNEVTNGPFGDITGGIFEVTLTAQVTLDGRDTELVGDPNFVARAYFPAGAISSGSGLVMYGGDPSAFDLFTSGGGSTNEIMYLNFIAACCGIGGSFMPGDGNGDGVVNAADLVSCAVAIREGEFLSPCELTGDELVNRDDLIELVRLIFSTSASN